MNVGVIVGISIVTVASGIADGVLNSVGKQNEAMYLSIATRSGIAVVALTTFAKFITALKGLG